MTARKTATLGVAAVASAAAALLAGGPAQALTSPTVHQTAVVNEMVGWAEVGQAEMVRGPKGVTMTIKTAIGGELLLNGVPQGVEWAPGDATMNVFVVFNDPTKCTGGVCDEDDVFDAFFGANLPRIGFHFAAGHVAGGEVWNAGGRLTEGDVGALFFGYPLEDSMAAEIDVVVVSKGPAAELTGQGGVLADALKVPGVGCDINVCGDVQVAHFPAP